MIVLPQGGLHPVQQGGDAGLPRRPLRHEIVTRLKTEQRWQDGKGKVVDAEPSVTRVTMAGHSGAGEALSE